MDALTRAFYELIFEMAFLKKTGDEFQNFFSDIMEKCHPASFQRVRPWGNMGDRKNDGYLQSERTLFQVYSPDTDSAVRTIAKIKEDFMGALPYWEPYFDRWIFVHNAPNGLAPSVLDTLLALNSEHPHIAVGRWGKEELRRNVFTLDAADLASLLGPAPSQKDLLDVRYADVQEVVDIVALQEPNIESDVRPVPSGKMQFNELSGSVQGLLEAGMKKVALVEGFFAQHPNPTFGDQVAQSFKRRFGTLKALQMEPDIIFHELQAFVGGTQRRHARYEAAILAVLAYFFEACDIFERPPDEVPS